MWWRWGSCFMQVSVCRPLVDAISFFLCSLRGDFETCIFCCHGARIRWAPHGLGWRHILATRKPAWVKQHVTNERRMPSLVSRLEKPVQRRPTLSAAESSPQRWVTWTCMVELLGLIDVTCMSVTSVVYVPCCQLVANDRQKINTYYILLVYCWLCG